VHLVASIPSPQSNSFTLGPLRIHYYGICIAVGIVLAFWILLRRWRSLGGDPGLAERVALWTVLAGFAGARIAYVSTHLYRFEGDPFGVLRIWEGGIAIYGGLVAGTAVCVLLLRRAKADVWAFGDCVALGLPLAQAVGRWGNWFNQELFGTPTGLPWGLEIAPANRPPQYADAATFHPTFLYESLWNLGVFGLLFWLDRRRVLAKGNLFVAYVALYGTGRFLMELIRTDTTFRLLGLSRNGWVALLSAVAAMVVLVVRQRRGRAMSAEEPGTVEPAMETDESEPPARTP